MKETSYDKDISSLLYETVTTAEQVVQELIAEGFARSDIHLALDHTKSHAIHNATGVQEVAYEGATRGGDTRGPWRAV